MPRRNPVESGQPEVIEKRSRNSLLQAAALQVISLVIAVDLLKMQAHS